MHRYDNYGWLRGFSLVPSWGARIEEAWWEYSPDRFREEAALATQVHANCLRLWIEFSAWMARPEAVTAAFVDAVTAVDELGMKAMPCLFNRWHDVRYDYGGTYTEDLYREWGYTALTRHRQEAHFYLHSEAQETRPLPGLEPEPDAIGERLREILGKRRHKNLAIDLDPTRAHPHGRLDREGARPARAIPPVHTPEPSPPDTDDELAGLLAGLRALSGGRGPGLGMDR